MARKRRIRRIMLDSSVYGAAIEDEERYSPDSERFWDIIYSKALFRLREKIDFHGCLPIESELKEAPQVFRRKLLEKFSVAKKLEENELVVLLFNEYVKAGIYPPDALILSYTSAHQVDALITINRRHLKAPETARVLKRVNRKFRLKTPLILLPRELFELIV